MDSIEREATNKEAAGQDLNNHVEATDTRATYIDKSYTPQLTREHHDYLMQRHGTIDLEPLPGHGNADPYNWPAWKV